MYELVIQVVFGLILATLFVYDARRGILPDFITLPAIVVVAVLHMVTGAVTWTAMVWGALVVGGFFAVQFAVSRGRWIGDGDIRMGVLMGVMLGLWPAVIAMFIAYVLGATVGGMLVLFGKKDRGAAVPFGTFLAVGTAGMLMWGERVVAWYAQWLR